MINKDAIYQDICECELKARSEYTSRLKDLYKPNPAEISGDDMALMKRLEKKYLDLKRRRGNFIKENV